MQYILMLFCKSIEMQGNNESDDVHSKKKSFFI
jgi:hypothetical protein